MVDQWVVDGLTVFGSVFGLEIVDRTNLAVLSLASRRHAASVWAGAALAFTLTTLVAVLIGQVVVIYLSPYILYVRLAGGAGIVAFGLYTLFLSKGEDEKDEEVVPRQRVFLQSLGLILVLETGDGTQILTIFFVVSIGNLVLVFVAALSALLLVLTLGVKGGQVLRGKLSPKSLQRISGVILVLVGAATIFFSLLFG